MPSLTLFSPAFLIVVSALAGIQQTTPKKDIPALTRRALKSVVLVVASDATGKELRQGSGFVVSSDGKVVTNHHVMEGAESAVIKFPNGAFHLIEGVVASDAAKDIVILKASGKDFPALALGDSDRVEIGEDVVAIGSPLSLEATVSSGIVSGIREWENLKVFQTTAPISPGSSGGPLLNLKGEVIGITTFQMRGGQNLNFALPTGYLKPLLTQDRVLPLTFAARAHTSTAGTNLTPDSLLNDPVFWQFSREERRELLLRADPGDYGRLPEEEQWKVVDVPPQKVRALVDHTKRGGDLSKKGLHLEAEREYRAALQLDPESDYLHFCLGYVLSKQKRSDEAIAEYLEAIRLKPDDGPAHHNVGLLLVERGDVDGGIAELREAVRLMPDDAQAHHKLGVALVRKGDLDSAIAECRRAIDLKPGAGVYTTLGIALSDRGDAYAAIDAYRAAIRLEPGDAGIHAPLAGELEKLGYETGKMNYVREAVQEWWTASSLDPGKYRDDYARASSRARLAGAIR
jgi:Flp pilus assembly protein TadD